MKKSSFIEGAMIATIGIIICRIIGLVYVIPFYAMLGVQGGTLYGYAYSIYAIFLNLSIVGIPVAMSKITSEYLTLGYYHTKERVFKIGKKIIVGFGLLAFIGLLIFAEPIAKLIIGDLEGGNTVADVTFVIRVISSALLIVPTYSVTKGYLQGHKMMTVPSMANIIEQLVRVAVILIGTYLTLNIFNLSIKTAVGISVAAATVGAIVSYFYLVKKINKNKLELKQNEIQKEEEKNITNKMLIRKIVFYAIPFIVIDLVNSAYSMVDVFTIVRTLSDLGYDAIAAETTYGVVCTWATKLTMIVISMATGLSVSLIPNITALYVKKDKKELNKKINLAITAILLVALPMTVGLFFLNQPVWIIFYGYDALSIDIFSMYIWQALTFSLMSILINILQSVNDTKLTLLTLFVSFVGKLVLSIPLIHLCHNIGIGGYFGPVLSSLIPHILAILLALYVLNKKYKINYSSSVVNVSKIILSTGIMVLSLMIISLFIPISSVTRLNSILEIILYASIGAIIYLVCIYKSGVVDSVLGKNFLNRFLKKKQRQ